MTNDILGSYITQNTGASFISLNLPMITAIIGAIGIILMFIRIVRDPEDRGVST
jgi:hypothetical protein